MSKKCPWCKVDVYLTEIKHWWKCPKCQTEFPERAFPKESTLFDHITTSHEALAERLVYPTHGMISRTWDFEKDDWGTAEPTWSSTVLPPNLFFGTREEAIAATLAELEKVTE